MCWVFRSWKPNLKQMYIHTSDTDMAEISYLIEAKVIIDVLGIQVFKAKCQANVHPHIWHRYGWDILFDQSKSQNRCVGNSSSESKCTITHLTMLWPRFLVWLKQKSESMCWEFKSWKPNVKQMYIHTSDTGIAETSCLIFHVLSLIPLLH